MKQKYIDINKASLSIRCKLYYNDLTKIRKAVVFGHGFGGHKDNRAAELFSERFLSKNKSGLVIIFDWPCHGTDNYPKLTLSICDKYLELVLEYIKETYKDALIYGHATSFGGYLFLKYIHDHGSPFKKTVLRCPAIDMYTPLYNMTLNSGNQALLEKGKDIFIGFDRMVKINKSFFDEIKEYDIRKYDYVDYSEDILIIHGTKDEIIPFNLSKAFSDENIIEFISVEDADHRFMNPNKMDIAISETIKFL